MVVLQYVSCHRICYGVPECLMIMLVFPPGFKKSMVKILKKGTFYMCTRDVRNELLISIWRLQISS